MREGDRKDIYLEWKSGYATPIEAARLLMLELGEIESEYSLTKAERDQVRNKLSEVVASIPIGKVKFDGLGRATITTPSVGHKYDRKRTDALLAYLQERHPDIAQMLHACQEQTENEGRLQVSFERTVKP